MTSSRAQVIRVVVAFDGSAPSRAALQVAVDEAAGRGTPLHLVTAIDILGVPTLSDAAYSQTARAANHDAAALAANILGADRVDTTVEVGAASAVVLRACRSGDLLVVGSQGHRPVARVFLGSTSTALVAHATCPVVVVKGTPTRPGGPVLVGIDGSRESADAVRFAADEASRRDVPLRALIAVPPVVDAMGFATGPDADTLEQARLMLSEALAGLHEDHPGLHIEQLLVQTHPVEALMRHASGAQLVVVGTRGLGGIRSMLLGSVSREMVQRTPCPVAVVHPVILPEGDDTDRRTTDSNAESVRTRTPYLLQLPV